MKRNLFPSLAILSFAISSFGLSGCTSPQSGQQQETTALAATNVVETTAGQSSRVAQATSLLKAFETGNTDVLRFVHPTLLKQHDPAIADGVEALKGAILQSAASKPRVYTLRAFQDSNFVVTQTLRLEQDTTQLSFDIFRFDEGLIVEHWDNSVRFATLKDSARLNEFVGTPTPVTDREKTQENRALVTRLASEVLLEPDYEKFIKFLDTAHYTDYNPYIQEGLLTYTENIMRKNADFTPDKIHGIWVEGDYALVVTGRHAEEQTLAFYDLFRIQNGKVVEHWNIFAPEPPQTVWKNQNGVLNF